MKKAIMALDGGGSNLRMLIVDKDTKEEIYYKKIETGTNLSTVPNKEEAIENIKNLIIDGHLHIPRDYILTGIGLSSAGTEIKENKDGLQNALEEVVETLKISSDRVNDNPPKLYVTNDIDILLHSSDIALVAGTGTVGAVKYKDIKPYDNTDEIPKEYVIEKFDGNGQFLGDKGAGYWIGKEVLKKVAEIENLGGYVNSKGEFIEESNSYLRQLVFEKIFAELDLPKEKLEIALQKGLKEAGLPEYVSLVYKVTEDNDKPFDRAKVGNLFSKIADDAALALDETANDILKEASIELFKNIRAAYNKGNFETKEECNLLLSGSVLVHSKIVRYFLETVVKEKYPNINIKVNEEKPVWSTIRYVEEKIENEKTEIKTNKDQGIER